MDKQASEPKSNHGNLADYCNFRFLLVVDHCSASEGLCVHYLPLSFALEYHYKLLYKRITIIKIIKEINIFIKMIKVITII